MGQGRSDADGTEGRASHRSDLLRYLRSELRSSSDTAHFDDRRFDQTEAAILVDECVESGKCTSDRSGPGFSRGTRTSRRVRACRPRARSSRSPKRRATHSSTALSPTLKKLGAYVATLTRRSEHTSRFPKRRTKVRGVLEGANAEEYTTTRPHPRTHGPRIGGLSTFASDARRDRHGRKVRRFDPLYREVSRRLVKS